MRFQSGTSVFKCIPRHIIVCKTKDRTHGALNKEQLHCVPCNDYINNLFSKTRKLSIVFSLPINEEHYCYYKDMIDHRSCEIKA